MEQISNVFLILGMTKKSDKCPYMGEEYRKSSLYVGQDGRTVKPGERNRVSCLLNHKPIDSVNITDSMSLFHLGTSKADVF
jgi:hypothetical protein